MNQPKHISSAQNPTIKRVKQLLTSHRHRKKMALTAVEGTHLIDAGLKAGYPIQQVLIAEKTMALVNVSAEVSALVERLQQANITILTLDNQLYQDIRTLGTGIDIMAILPIKQVELPQIDNTDCLILNDVQDSGNVGTLLRTAAAVGIANIICTTATAQAWSPKVLRAGMGANFSLNIYENVTVEEVLEKVQVPMFATSSHTQKVLYQTDLTQAVAWVMGHEGQGVCDKIMAQAEPITIPQPNGQESLNVAIAGALCMYECVRQRAYG